MKTILLCIPLLFLQLMAFSQADEAAKAKALKDLVNNNCDNLIKDYNDMLFAINAMKKSKPEIPVPPALDIDCHDCKEQGYEDKNQPIIDAFIKKSVQPESDLIKTLLRILRDKTILLGGKFTHGNVSLVPDTYDDPNTYSCLNYFKDDEMRDMLAFLENRMYEKISMMLKKYKSQGEYFIAGAALYLGVSRDLALLDYDRYGNTSFDELAYWSTKYYERSRDRLFNQYQYQLYPGIFYMPRDMLLMMGGDDSYFTQQKTVLDNSKYKLENQNGVMKAWNEAITFMHFRLKISYDGTGFSQSGDRVNVHFSGETEVRCRVDGSHQTPCYTWETENGNMTFKVKQVEFHDVQSTHDTIVTTYSGPEEFTVPVKFNINMCDNAPVFRMFFDRLWPQEEHYHNNHEGAVTTPMLYRLVSATLGKVNTGGLEKEVEKMKTKANNNPYSEADMEAWNQRMEAHANDPNYFKTEQGKKDLATAQQLKQKYGSISSADQQKLQQVRDAKASMDKKEQGDANYFGSAEWHADNQQLQQASRKGLQVMQNFTGGALSLNKLELPFKTGSKIPVKGSVGDSGPGLMIAVANGTDVNYNSTFTITLENAPDDKDNMKQ